MLISSRVLDSITEEVIKMQSRSRVTRALSVQADKEKIAGFYTRMKNELDTLSVSSWHTAHSYTQNNQLIANLTVLKFASGGPQTPDPAPLEWVMYALSLCELRSP